MDAEAKKKLLRKIPYGLYVATAKKGEEVAAGTINWLSQASFEPPLLMAALKKDSGLHALALETGIFALSFLAQGQKDIAQAFFKPAKLEGGKLSGQEISFSPSGCPVLKNALGWAEAQVVEVLQKGDHSVFLAEVKEVCLSEDEPMLLLADTGWNYGG